MNSEATCTVDIELPVEQAWEKLRDFTQSVNYVPNLTGCKLHPGPTDGVGASRRVFQKNGKSLDETITQWRDMQGFTMRLHEGEGPAPAPFGEASFTYDIQPAGNKTRFTATMNYSIRGGLMGRLMDRLILKKVLTRAVSQIARNMKHYYETGVPSNRG